MLIVEPIGINIGYRMLFTNARQIELRQLVILFSMGLTAAVSTNEMHESVLVFTLEMEHSGVSV